MNAPQDKRVVGVYVYPTPSEDITTVPTTTSLGTAAGKSAPGPLWYITRVVSVTEVQKIEPKSTVLLTQAASAFTYVPAAMLVHALVRLAPCGDSLRRGAISCAFADPHVVVEWFCLIAQLELGLLYPCS